MIALESLPDLQFGVAEAPPQAPAEAPAEAPPQALAEGVAYDAAARAYYDCETGALLADMAAWERAPESERARARARLEAVRRAEALIAAGMPRREADAAAAGKPGASGGGVRRWRGKAARVPQGARAAALLTAKRSGRPPKIDAAMAETLTALALRHGPHLTSKLARKALIARHGHAPARSTVREWIRNWNRRNERRALAVTNPDLDRSRHKPAGGNASAGIERLNQLWELDSTTADVMCADGKRYSIVGAIDIWSRRARVLIAPASSAESIAALLRLCILDWGVPEAVRTDEGRDYTSNRTLGALEDLEIEHLPCPAYSPERKPHIERFLGTLARDLFAALPGFTGHNVVQAQALRARKSFAGRRGKGDAEIFGAALSPDDLQAACDHWCEHVYGRDPHEGLGGLSPFARVAAWQGPLRRICDERALDALLAEPAGGGWRVIRKKGIALDNAYYIAGPLGALVGERVKVRRDPADSGRIHVYRADGEFLCVAENPAATGADQAAIAARMSAAWRADRKGMRQLARELEREIDPAGLAARTLTGAADAGRVVAFPKPAAAHRTAALTQAGRAARAAGPAGKAKAQAAGASPALAAAGILFGGEEEI